MSLFSAAGQSKGLPQELLEYKAGFLAEEKSDILLNDFIADVPWSQKLVKMYDKEILTPRLTAWYGDQRGIDYGSSGKSKPLDWTPDLLWLKSLVEPVSGIAFNSVLLNYYRDGRDSVAWHSDKETVMGSHPVIASVSFGAVRSFDIRSKADHSEKYSIRLEHGSLLIMKGDLQSRWQHRIAKSNLSLGPRINLTFRKIVNQHISTQE